MQRGLQMAALQLLSSVLQYGSSFETTRAYCHRSGARRKTSNQSRTWTWKWYVVATRSGLPFALFSHDRSCAGSVQTLSRAFSSFGTRLLGTFDFIHAVPKGEHEHLYESFEMRSLTGRGAEMPWLGFYITRFPRKLPMLSVLAALLPRTMTSLSRRMIISILCPMCNHSNATPMVLQ